MRQENDSNTAGLRLTRDRVSQSGALNKVISLFPPAVTYRQPAHVPAPSRPVRAGPAPLQEGRPEKIDSLPDQLLLAVIQDSPVATIVLDREHRVRLANRLANKILDKRDSFAVDRRRVLRIVDPFEKRSFDHFLKAVFDQPVVEGAPAPARYLLSRPPLAPVSVTAITWGKRGNGKTKRLDCVILLLRDPTVTQLPSHEVLRTWFGFTKAEAQLANAIASGKTIHDYYSERRVTLNTVKTQFQSILDKTGVHRQVELVRLLTSL